MLLANGGRFTFDRATHTYRVGSTAVPGITSIIRRAGLTDEEWASEDALARGTAVHWATLALDLGDEAVLRPEWLGYLKAWREFRRAVPCAWTELEQPRLARGYGFAGTPDRIGTLRGRPAVVEIKTGGAADWHPLQTAAQELLLGGVPGQRIRRAVYLAADGRFTVRRHEDPTDYLRFLELHHAP